MKKKYCLCIFFLLICSAVFAIDLSVSLLPLFSLKNSNSKEALYFSGSFGSDSSKMCSLLEWNQEHVFSLGLESELSLKINNSNFKFTAGAQYALPFNNGKMRDKDWSTAGKLTTSSSFNNELNKDINIWTYFFYKRDFKYFSVIPFVGFDFSYLYFNATNGCGWYDLDTSTPHYYPDGKYHLAGIDFKSYKTQLFTGFGIEKKLKSFIVEAGGELSPFSFVLIKDRHLARNYTFKDYIYSSFDNYLIYAKLSFIIGQKLSFLLNLKYNQFFLTKGDEYIDWDEDSRDSLSGQKAGYSYYELKFTFGLKWNIK